MNFQKSKLCMFKPTISWGMVGLVLMIPSIWVQFLSKDLPLSFFLMWQPELFLQQPWRAWTAVWVHLSAMHFWGCFAAALLTFLLGLAIPVGTGAATAWLMTWPLTQLTLLLQPELTRYGGMSGVLHAGVSILAVQLLKMPSCSHRFLGLSIAIGMFIKIFFEAPWRGPLLYTPAWDIPVAPLSHAAGVFWGGVCGMFFVRHKQFLKVHNTF
jgi:rhomboid family GlyGly-CTERM serine protease